MEHGAKTIFGVLKEKLLVQNSKTLVDCFDYLKSYSTHLLSLQLHLQQIRTKFHQKTAFRLLKQNLLNKRKKQENEVIAERYLKVKSKRQMKRVILNMGRVLRLEAMWLKEVRY